jgi:hypothetical protein
VFQTSTLLEEAFAMHLYGCHFEVGAAEVLQYDIVDVVLAANIANDERTPSHLPYKI